MDYRREARNAVTWFDQMTTAGVEGVTIAQPIEGLSSGYVLMTEWVEGERVVELGWGGLGWVLLWG